MHELQNHRGTWRKDIPPHGSTAPGALSDPRGRWDRVKAFTSGGGVRHRFPTDGTEWPVFTGTGGFRRQLNNGENR